MVTSASRLMGPTHPGRPATEEPHVKKTMKGKREKCDLICRIDQVYELNNCFGIFSLKVCQDELGILEDEFDDLKQLFQVGIWFSVIFR